MKTKEKAIALCRVSTSKQRLEGKSLEAQETRVYECADYLNAEIVKLWSLDTSSRKGKNFNRPDLLEMLKYIKQNKAIKYVIVDEADRFMRSIDEAYFWKVQFKSYGATIAYANMPEITHEDDPMAVMREMMAMFQAEVSNHERITKTTDKMKARIQAGYYPGMVHQGYKKSEIKGLHIPREPQWSLLQSAMKKIIYDSYNLDEALIWLNNNNYKLQGGGPLDMWKLKRIIKEPFYAGVIKMSNWETVCNHGLHKSMITFEEHEKLLQIANGKQKKFTVHKYNPLFYASNIVECADCLAEGAHISKLVGYEHHNNKPPRTRRYYQRYRCRGCNKNILKEKLHSGLDEIFDKTELIFDEDGLLIESLRKAWKTEISESYETIGRLNHKLALLNNEKDNLVRTLGSNPDIADDIKSSINCIKHEINNTKDEINRHSKIEEDFDDFVKFAIDFTNNIKDNWWNIENPHDRIRFKQLVYPNGLTVSRSGKVLTPTLSPIYRYKISKKTPESAFSSSEISFGGPGGT